MGAQGRSGISVVVKNSVCGACRPPPSRRWLSVWGGTIAPIVVILAIVFMVYEVIDKAMVERNLDIKRHATIVQPPLLKRVREAVGDPDNFLHFPTLKSKHLSSVDVVWDGGSWERVENAVDGKAIVRVGLVARDPNWPSTVARNLKYLPDGIRVVLVGRFSQNFGVLSKESVQSTDQLRGVLEDKRIVKWVVNQLPVISHPKIVAWPLGVNDWPSPHFVRRIWERADQKKFKRNYTVSVLHEPRESDDKRKNLFYLSKILARSHPRDVFVLDKPNCKGVRRNKCWEPYIDAALRSKMVISAPGAGWDCHRTYEVIAAGAVPVVEHSAMDKTFDNLPVILVDSLFHSLKNFKSLHEKYEALMKRTDFKLNQLRSDYYMT